MKTKMRADRKIRDAFSQTSPHKLKVITIEIAKFAFRVLLEFIIFVALIFFAMSSSIGLMLLLGLIFINVKKAVKVAFADPEEMGYERKSNKELFVFLFHACCTAFMFTIISFQIFMYIALLFWFYFIIFMLMFSRVWKFHGKKPIVLFAILILATVISMAVAPTVRSIIHGVFNFMGIY